jgi:DNA-binding beta-propeller fold protein YncE
MLHGNGNLWSADAATGQPGGKSGSILWDEKDANHTENLDATQVLDMDVRGNQMVASYANHNAVRWLNLANASVQDEAAVPEPLGIALAPDRKVLVISQGKVVFLSRDNKTPRTLIAGLTSPWRLAVDQKNGDVFVAERGEGQQVKKFSKRAGYSKSSAQRRTPQAGVV